jgi:hypothetical protein
MGISRARRQMPPSATMSRRCFSSESIIARAISFHIQESTGGKDCVENPLKQRLKSVHAS